MGPNLDCPTHTISYSDFNSTINNSKASKIWLLTAISMPFPGKSCNSWPFLKAEFFKNCSHIVLHRPCFHWARHFEGIIMFLICAFSLLTIESENSGKAAGSPCLSKLTSRSCMLLIWFYFCMCQTGYFISSYTADHWQVCVPGNRAVLSVWCLFSQAHCVRRCILHCAVQWSTYTHWDLI